VLGAGVHMQDSGRDGVDTRGLESGARDPAPGVGAGIAPGGVRQTTLAAIVMTLNEERDLPACLESLKDLATEVWVVDSGSTDRTVAVAGEHGARVLSHPFTNHATQFNLALESIASESKWVMRIDADERLSDRLREQMRAALREAP
jgi:glycosyltransferase involved in cell wall biosynthesis